MVKEIFCWFETAIRNHEAEHGSSGGAWNISMILERLHRENNLHESRRHERSQDERLDRLEHEEATLERKMTKAMADIDELNSILQGIASDATTLTADFKNLEAELQAAQQAAANNQPIDLTNAILLARGAQTALDGIVQTAGTIASPAPAPVDPGAQVPVEEQPPVDETVGEQPPVEEQPSVDETVGDQPPVEEQPPA